MSKHTQGPWVLAPYGRMPNGVTMFWVNKKTSVGTSNIHDANLIAAAPELLEFAEYVANLETGGVIDRKAKQVIAKAKGSVCQT